MQSAVQENHFAILGLDIPTRIDGTANIDLDRVRRAYHRALLKHHPDKTVDTDRSVTGPIVTPTVSIDRLKQAYAALSTPAGYRAYLTVLLNSPCQSTNPAHGGGRTDDGIESVDLDQMQFVDFSRPTAVSEPDSSNRRLAEQLAVLAEAENISGPAYIHPCRCAFPLGFLVTEAELEHAFDSAQLEAAIDGARQSSGELVEVAVGCRGCSLWIRVQFSAADETDG